MFRVNIITGGLMLLTALVATTWAEVVEVEVTKLEVYYPVGTLSCPDGVLNWTRNNSVFKLDSDTNIRQVKVRATFAVFQKLDAKGQLRADVGGDATSLNYLVYSNWIKINKFSNSEDIQSVLWAHGGVQDDTTRINYVYDQITWREKNQVALLSELADGAKEDADAKLQNKDFKAYKVIVITKENKKALTGQEAAEALNKEWCPLLKVQNSRLPASCLKLEVHYPSDQINKTNINERRISSLKRGEEYPVAVFQKLAEGEFELRADVGGNAYIVGGNASSLPATLELTAPAIKITRDNRNWIKININSDIQSVLYADPGVQDDTTRINKVYDLITKYEERSQERGQTWLLYTLARYAYNNNNGEGRGRIYYKVIVITKEKAPQALTGLNASQPAQALTGPAALGKLCPALKAKNRGSYQRAVRLGYCPEESAIQPEA